MTWEQFFLACFTFGFVFSLVGFLAGSAHLHFHMGHGHFHGGGGGVSKFNFGTISAFLTWFGGSGYILSNWGGLGLLLVLLLSALTRVPGGPVIFPFAPQILAPRDKALDPADYRVIGRARQSFQHRAAEWHRR